jgi:hypothetical protein
VDYTKPYRNAVDHIWGKYTPVKHSQKPLIGYRGLVSVVLKVFEAYTHNAKTNSITMVWSPGMIKNVHHEVEAEM